MVERNPGDQPPYPGPERRRGVERRKGDVRREEIRWEPQKKDRRSGKDRRLHGGWDGTSIR